MSLPGVDLLLDGGKCHVLVPLIFLRWNEKGSAHSGGAFLFDLPLIYGAMINRSLRVRLPAVMFTRYIPAASSPLS